MFDVSRLFDHLSNKPKFMDSYWIRNCKEQLVAWKQLVCSRSPDRVHAPPQVSSLEARIMLDANPIALDDQSVSGFDQSLDVDALFLPLTLPETFLLAPIDSSDLDQTDQVASNSSEPMHAAFDSWSFESTRLGKELVVVDESIQDLQSILEGLEQQKSSGRDFEVLITRTDQDGIVEITNLLSQLEDVSALHIISHGGEGEIQLGNVTLNSQTLAERAAGLKSWQSHLQASADVLIYGCNLAANEAGERFIDQLSGLIDADIAASDDLTGHLALGGDWDLEYQHGLISTAIATAPATVDSWHGLLATASTVTTGNQETTDDDGGSQHAIAMDANGNYVVVWSSDYNGAGHDPSGFGVYFQLFDKFGNKIGSEQLVNSNTSDDQDQASVAMDDSGKFFITWVDHSNTGPGSGDRVFAKGYNADGSVRLSDFIVSTGSDPASNPTIDMNSSGDFLIAWERHAASDDIYARHFGPSGAGISTAFRVHSASADQEANPSVALADDGTFTVFWKDSTHVHGDRFSSLGAPLLASPITILGEEASVAIENDGTLSVTYVFSDEVWLDRYTADGTLSSSQSLSGPLLWAYDTSISRAGDGSYFVSWAADGTGPDLANIYLARVSSTGTLSGVSEISDANLQSAGSFAAYDLNHYAYAYTTRVLIDGDVEVDQVGVWVQRRHPPIQVWQPMKMCPTRLVWETFRLPILTEISFLKFKSRRAQRMEHFCLTEPRLR